MKSKKVAEIDVLTLYVDEMERRGVKYDLVEISVDEAMAIALEKKLGVSTDLECLRKLADRCLANQWLEHRVMGGKYHHIGISSTGFGVVRSHQRKQAILAQRTRLKKISDFIEEHKGLFVLIGAAITLSGVLVRLFYGDAQ